MKHLFVLSMLVYSSFAKSQALAMTNEKMEVAVFAEGNWEIRKISDEFNLPQTTAVTENGAQLILYKDKTWKYANLKDREAFKNIAVNKKLFTKPTSADSLVSSERADGGVYLDTKKWKAYESDDIRFSEYQFTGPDASELYGYFYCINSKKENIEAIKNEAIGSILSSPNNSTLKKTEYRTVNGLPMFHMYYSKKIDGDRFDFLDNYFQTAYGYCHISGYTYSNLVAKNKEEIEKLINGLSKAEQVNKNQQAPVPPPQVYK
ncbi:hypothetical protein [Chryseobacterium sp.]|uniref:hypothetical protein n=1 Tax=Chryseobacterium sp. TaxID=1871047 RepID=UPI0025BE5F5C|nr:hypothetical protein [Chryseobacterium sp.]